MTTDRPGEWEAAKEYDGRFRHEAHEALYEHSGYSNLGYWDDQTANPVQACDNLVDKLVQMLPDTKGTILDVACGAGGTTKRLARHFEPSKITAINISKYQIERARKTAPGSTCLEMSATELSFPRESFNHVICVEAAFNFRSRSRFFAEAYRVLKPGGGLCLADILVETPPGMTRITTNDLRHHEVPLVNRVNAETYRDIMGVVGFRNIEMTSVLNRTWHPYKTYLAGFTTFRLAQMKPDRVTAAHLHEYGILQQVIEHGDRDFQDYILVSAVK
jgi:ubiquinone/menaquinone biosynthesis C-methylase UbiE